MEQLQAFLLKLHGRAKYSDEVISQEVRIIWERRGLLTINELTEKLGYSQRYLAMKFDPFVGLGPKNLAKIVRFQSRFVSLTRFACVAEAAQVNDDYYDQSHFPREFKCFAGPHPATYLRKTNEFMTMFYRGVSGSSENQTSSASQPAPKI